MSNSSPVYYLIARSFTENSAGIRAMHILCNTLNVLGFEAYLVGVDRSFQINMNLNTPLLDRRRRNEHFNSKRRTISVSDESVRENPLNANLAVTWLLNRGGFLAGKRFRKVKACALSFVYSQEINKDFERLFVNTVDYDFFRSGQPKDEGVRTLSLFYAGKLKSLGIDVDKPAGAIEIHRSGPSKQSREELRELLYRARILYLAEDSALALEAAICGCPTMHLIENFDQEPLSGQDGGIGLVENDDSLSLLSVNLKPEFIERYMATLEIRTYYDVLNFALFCCGSLENCDSKGKPKVKISYTSKAIMRFNKLMAAFRASGIKGLACLVTSYFDQRKSAPRFRHD